jgi:hypothetical protein
MNLHKITEFYTKWFSFCPNITLQICTTAIFQTSVKESRLLIQMKLVGISMIFRCTNLRLSKYKVLWVVSIKQNVNFKYQPQAIFVFSGFSQTWSFKRCSPFQDLSACRISWSRVDWYEVRIHLRSFKIPPSQYSKFRSMKIIIQMKLVGMSMVYCCVSLRSCSCRGS